MIEPGGHNFVRREKPEPDGNPGTRKFSSGSINFRAKSRNFAGSREGDIAALSNHFMKLARKSAVSMQQKTCRRGHQAHQTGQNPD